MITETITGKQVSLYAEGGVLWLNSNEARKLESHHNGSVVERYDMVRHVGFCRPPWVKFNKIGIAFSLQAVAQICGNYPTEKWNETADNYWQRVFNDVREIVERHGAYPALDSEAMSRQLIKQAAKKRIGGA